VAAGLVTVAAGSPATAQSPATFSSYITPFPETDRYQTYVIGDWLAISLASGLEDAFKQDGAIQVRNATRPNAGLLRGFDWAAEVARLTASGPVHIAVVMMGVNDARNIRSGETVLRPGTPEWREAYTKEAEKLIKAFRSVGVAVYWVGLPAIGTPTLGGAVETMNDAVRQAAYLNGAKFIDTWSGFTDQAGAYSAFGPDLTGQTKRLRDGDGVGFTGAGSRKLAYYVEIVLKRDLAAARQQRNIPLAGDEEEQSRVVPRLARARAGGAPSDLAEDAAAASGAGLAQTERAPGRVDYAAFAAAVIPTDMVFGDLSSGLTSIAVISPLSDLSLRDSQRRIPLSERLYFRVLSKGEALPPKEGRADDFSWKTGDTAQQ
jgi:hypothetical protein